MVLLNSTALSAFSDAKNSASLSSLNISTISETEKKIWYEYSHRGPYQQALAACSETHLRMSPRETAEGALQLQALRHSHRDATRLFLLAVREGATDAQITHALRQGFPHLTDPASLQDRRAGKHPDS